MNYIDCSECTYGYLSESNNLKKDDPRGNKNGPCIYNGLDDNLLDLNIAFERDIQRLAAKHGIDAEWYKKMRTERFIKILESGDKERARNFLAEVPDVKGLLMTIGVGDAYKRILRKYAKLFNEKIVKESDRIGISITDDAEYALQNMDLNISSCPSYEESEEHKKIKKLDPEEVFSL